MERYIQKLRDKNLSENTIATYERFLKTIPKRLNAKAAANFVVGLRKNVKSNATLRLYLIIFKSYLKFLGKKDIAYSIMMPKKENKKMNIPTIEIENMINKSTADPFHHAIILTLADTGLRLSEFCDLRLSDYYKNNTQISIIGKGNRIRIIFFSDRVQQAINEYIKIRNHPSDYLFVSKYGRCYQKMIDRVLKKYSPKLHPHILRHYFAVRLLKNGANIMAVRDLLGHSDISTTQIYLNLSNIYLKETYYKYI